MKVLIAGGTGFLGRTIADKAADNGHAVTVMSRSRPGDLDPRFEWVEGNATKPESLEGKLQGFDAVVDAVQFPNSPIEDPKKGYTFERVDYGGTRNLVDAAKTAGTPHFVDLSGVGADEASHYHWMRFKALEEQYLRDSAVPFTVFRPSWIYGPGDVSLNRFLGFARWLPFVPVVGNGKTRINPLFVGDIGTHVAAAITKGPRNAVFEIGGPSVMTMDEVIKTALRQAGKRRLLLHGPKPVMKLVASLLQHAPGRPLTPDAVDFITADGIADIGPLQDEFGLPLTEPEEGMASYLRQ